MRFRFDAMDGSEVNVDRGTKTGVYWWLAQKSIGSYQDHPNHCHFLRWDFW